MSRKATIALLCLSAMFGGVKIAGAVSNAGVLFLRIAAGARAAGMGEAFVAVADDATATHWNPAGLGQYPLYGKWVEVAPPKDRAITQAVLLRSVMLGEAQAAYDLWAIADGKLMRYSGGKWETDVPLPEGVTRVTALCASEQDLWMATDQGLFRFSLLSWKPVVAPTDQGWESEQINDLYVTAGPRLWLATDDGVKSYDGMQWTSYGVESGLPSPKVLKVYFVNSQLGWAVTAAGLARFEAGKFDEAEQIHALIGEGVPKLAARFIGTEDSVRIARASEEIRRFNNFEGDELAPGTTVRIPYSLVFESPITCLTSDVSSRLWVGTAQGLKVYEQKRWRSFGYRAYAPREPITVTALAELSLGGRATPTRVAAYVQWTARYNNLTPEDTIQPGRTVYLYNTSTGGPIRALMANGYQLYVASKYGFLVYEEGQWRRMYHAGLEHADGIGLAQAGRDLWFFTPDKLVTNARARTEVTFMHVNWLPELASDMYYEYVSLVTHKEGWGTIGVNVTFLTYGEVARTESDPQVVGYFNPFDLAFGLSYGTRLAPDLAAGLTAKVIYSRLSEQGAGAEKGEGTATAFALDGGLLYNPWSKLRLGAALTNLGPDISYIDADQSDPLPRNLAVGFSYKLLDSPYNRLTFIGEMNKDLTDWGRVHLGVGDTTSSGIVVGHESLRHLAVYNVGLEYWYAGLVALRCGYINDESGDIKTPTVGAGLFWKGLEIDLAYVPSVREDQVMANILRMSLTGRF